MIYKMWELSGWGNNLEWSDYEKRRVVGWMSPKPKVGDEMQCKMESGKILQCIFETIEPADGVHDMFFSTMKIIGYLE